MLLSNLIGMPVFVGEKQRGTLQGVFLSTKSKCVKYLLCAIEQKNTQTTLAVSVCALERVNDGIHLKRIRSILPKNAALFKCGCPVYTENGTYVGCACDLHLHELTATELVTESAVFPTTSIAAIGDAVLVKTDEPYPIGQRIPAPILSTFSTSEQCLLVTRPLLKSVIKKGRLIAFTLSLAPFSL